MWLLGVIGLAAAVLLASVHYLTRDRIALEQARQTLDTLHQVLPADSYDNELATDTLTIRIPGLAGDAVAYRARRDGAPAGLIVEAVTDEGYSGPIRLLIGIFPDGHIAGVRVLSHRETPGLGDAIELGRSNWIRGFDGRSLGDPDPDRWHVSRRGGDFDTLTSATITTEAVVVAVRRVLAYVAANRERLFSETAEVAE